MRIRAHFTSKNSVALPKTKPNPISCVLTIEIKLNYKISLLHYINTGLLNESIHRQIYDQCAVSIPSPRYQIKHESLQTHIVVKLSASRKYGNEAEDKEEFSRVYARLFALGKNKAELNKFGEAIIGQIVAQIREGSERKGPKHKLANALKRESKKSDLASGQEEKFVKLGTNWEDYRAMINEARQARKLAEAEKK